MIARVDPPEWYQPPSDDKLREAYDDKVAAVLVNEHTRIERLRESNLQLDLERRKAQQAGEQKSFEDTLSDLRTSAIARIERARDAAKYVQTASIAAAGLYTGLLGFVFGFAEGATALPIRAVIPTVFFGLSIAFSTWYLAFLPDRATTVRWQRPRNTPRGNAQSHLATVGMVVTASVTQRAWSMRAAALSLLVAVTCLPIAFIGPPRGLLEDVGTRVFGPTEEVASAASDVGAIEWPAPPSFASDRLSLELYKRQLDTFEKSIAPKASTPSTWWDYELLIAAFLLIVVVCVAALTMGRPWAGWRPHGASAAASEEPRDSNGPPPPSTVSSG